MTLAVHPWLAGIHAVLVAGLFLTFGRLIAGAVLGRDGVGMWDLWGASFVALCAFAAVLEVLNIATSGAVLGNATAARAVTAGAALISAWWAYRRRLPRQRHAGRSEVALALLVVAAGLLVWCTPVFRVVPLSVEGDTHLHTGWTNELLNGEPLPSATITGDVPNFYPWLYHALLALLTQVTPGGRAHLGLAPLQVLQVSGVLLALFALGRRIDRRPAVGAVASLLAALAGGFGFVVARRPELVVDPRQDALRYLGDMLLKRSYTVGFYDIAPAFPRDVSWTLLVGAILLLVVAQKTTNTRALVAAGCAIGLTGLVGAESFFVAFGVALVLAIVLGGSRRRIAAYVILPALATYGLWLVPQAIGYVRLGGYVNLTLPETGPVSLPAYAIVAAWGVTAPLAVVGAVASWRRARANQGVLILFVLLGVAVAALVASSVLPAAFGPAFATLGRAHRYWPLVHLGVALMAALGAIELIDRAPSPRGAALLYVGLVALAVPSPVLASLAYPRETALPRAPVPEALRGNPRALLNLVAPRPSAECHAAVPAEIDTAVWSYSGYRLVSYDREGAPKGNGARIRWAGIYSRIASPEQRREDNKVLTQGPASRSRWEAVARRYAVDVVVSSDEAAAHSPFRQLEGVHAEGSPYTVFRLTRCGT